MAFRLNKTLLQAVLILSLFTTLPAVPMQAQWGTSVDPFTQGQASIKSDEVGVPAYRIQSDSTNTILGGVRKVRTEKTAGQEYAGVSTFASAGTFNHNQDSGTYGYTIITWDGDNSSNELNPIGLNPTGLVPVNLTANGSDRIHIIGIESDHSGVDLVVTVYSNEDEWSVATIQNIPALSGPQDFQFLFGSDFVEGDGAIGPADFSDVGAITLEINGEDVSMLDLSIDLIAAGGPTAVSLTSFNAAPASGNILLTWETGSETNLQGFNLHRSETTNGAYTQINTSVIQALNHGQPVGASYSWLDEDVVRGETYYYKLEGLEDGGLKSYFGPVSARAVHTVYLPLLVRN